MSFHAESELAGLGSLKQIHTGKKLNKTRWVYVRANGKLGNQTLTTEQASKRYLGK